MTSKYNFFSFLSPLNPFREIENHIEMAFQVKNPETGRDITIGLATCKKLIKQGYVLAIDWHSRDREAVLRNPMNNIMDQAIPFINVVPLKPTGGSISSNSSFQKFEKLFEKQKYVCHYCWSF